MKAAIIILLFAITLPCFAQLTKQDVELIIQKALEPINKEIIAIKLDIAEMKGKMATKDDIAEISKMATKDDIIGIYAAILGTWIVTIAAIVTIPYLYGRADREKVKQLEVDVRELIKLRADVEVLKAIKEAEENRRETARKIAEEKPEFAEAYRMVGLL